MIPMGRAKNTWNQFLRYAGCAEGQRAYTGPRRAEVYLTNRCNLDCIACWSFSPLLEGRHLPPQVELKWEKADQLLRDLAAGGCEEIQFVGGGEPMIYPSIMEALERTKSLGMRCFVTTNLTPVTPKRAERMVQLGVDRIYVSLWAATPKTYAATHPKSGEEVFVKIDETLRRLDELKGGERLARPQVIIRNVIFKQNHHEVRTMVDYAADVGAAAVDFTLAYTFPGSTDVLLLDDSMREKVRRQLDSIPEEVRRMEGHHGPGTFLYEMDNFSRRLSALSEGEGELDRSVLERVPCQIGWFHVIIQADGVVIPCCKGQSKPLGNIYEKSFREIWYSSQYDEFRRKAKYLPKSDPYFASIDCYKMCDNVGMLKMIEERMQRLRPIEGVTRRLVAPLLRTGKR